jgi:hypothetical protein
MEVSEMSRVCEHCKTEAKAWTYQSPLWAGAVLVPACLVISCECGEDYDYVHTAYRGEKLYSFPDAGVSEAVIEQQWAAVKAVPASPYEAELVAAVQGGAE